MRTDDLIQKLSSNTQAVSPRAAEQRVVARLLLGGLAATGLMVPWMGLRPDLPGAMMTAPFLMKWAYTISLGVIAAAAVLHVARPEAQAWRGTWLVLVPVAVLALMAGVELATTPSAQWMEMWLGRSWSECSVRVTLLALPVFAGLLWSFRGLAPTRLRSAGAVSGLSAGAFAATVYGLHCPEVSATFVATWYTLGIAAAAGIGALAGPRLLRW
ncbi:MAG: DUF1109 domain-containing protein [Sphingobium sp.]|nr:DUF1109 domain-containing protein [Sphingobium sp.]